MTQLLTDALVAGCLYAIAATGFGFIYNTTRIFHVAYGATYVSAAYAADALVGMGWSLGSAAVVGVAFAASIGIAVEHFIYAPLIKRGAPLAVLLLSSLGLYVAVVNLLVLLAGNETRILRPGIQRVYRIGGFVTDVQLLQVASALLLLPAFFVFLRHSALGRTVRAVRDDPVLASVMGTRESAIRKFVFGLGSAACGLAAILTAADVGITPYAGMPLMLVATVATVVGGVGVFEGAAVGAVVLALVRAVVIWYSSARWTDAVTFVLLLGFLLFRPRGCLGGKTRFEEAAA